MGARVQDGRPGQDIFFPLDSMEYASVEIYANSVFIYIKFYWTGKLGFIFLHVVCVEVCM